MKKINIEWNHDGFQEILCSDGAGMVCQQEAQAIEDRANGNLSSDKTEGYKSGGKIVTAYGSKRWMYFVYTTDAETMYAEQDNQALSKAVN